MNVEGIARVVADLRAGRVLDTSIAKDRVPPPDWVPLRDVPVVDVTAVYDQWMETGDGRFIYEDHSAAPPWDHALLGYVNPAGNVCAIDFSAVEVTDPARFAPWQPADDPYHYGWQPSDVEHRIDWERVRWFITAWVYSGGRTSKGVPVPTAGPLHMWRIPVYPDGSIADVQWTLLDRHFTLSVFNNAMMTMLATLNLCNCVNVVVAPAQRSLSRAEHRRLGRTGVTLSEIHIRPLSRSSQGVAVPLADIRRLHGVRGHFATYGGDGRGLLFGKYSGRYWIPPHARGQAQRGEVRQDYVVEVES